MFLLMPPGSVHLRADSGQRHRLFFADAGAEDSRFRFDQRSGRKISMITALVLPGAVNDLTESAAPAAVAVEFGKVESS